MRKILVLIMTILVAIFIIGCENTTNPMQSENQIAGERSLQKKGGEQAINVPDDFTTIQDAVNAVDGKGVIYVGDGVYNESVIIDGKEISLIANGNALIAPLTMVGHGDAIQIYNSKATIDGFEIDATNCKGGIYAGGGYPVNDDAVTVIITNNEVYSYKKNGITINGSEAYGNISNNKVWGSGPLGVPYYAQNGIQFGYGGTGNANNNYIEGNLYTGPDWGATGLLIFESGDVIAQNNIIKSCGTGVAVQTWGWYMANGNNNKIDKNTVLNCEWGISIAAYDWVYSNMDCFANNNKVVNNTVFDDSGDGIVGIEVYLYDVGGYTPSVDNNKIIHNKIEGYDPAIDDVGSTKTKIHANVYE